MINDPSGGLQVPGWARTLWEMVPRFMTAARVRRLFWGLALVLTIEVCSHWAYEHGAFPNLARSAMDAMMARHVGVARATSIYKEPPPAFTFIDADDETWSAWGNPARFRRETLVPIIKYARDCGARAIVVDVDTSDLGSNGAAELELQRLLREYPTAKKERCGEGESRAGERTEQAKPPLILGQWFVPAPKTFARVNLSAVGSQPHGPTVYAAAPLFDMDRDAVVREWRLWEPQCENPDKAQQAVPSIQLLLLALLQPEQRTPEERTRQLILDLGKARDAYCPLQTFRDAKGGEFPVGAVSIDLRKEGSNTRILYTLTPDHAFQTRTKIAGHDVDMVRTLSASAIPDVTEGGKHKLSGDQVRDRVVVIGSSAWAARDWHATPIGGLPGPWIIINAVSTITQFGPLHAPAFRTSLIVNLGIGLVLWGLLELLPLSVALVLCAAVISGASFIASRWLLEGSGVWTDAGLPSLGFVVHRWVDDIYGFARRCIAEWSWRPLFAKHGENLAAESSRQSEERHGTGTARRASRAARSTIVLAFVGAGVGAARADMAQQVAGRIVGMEGDPGDYEIIRAGGERLPAAYYADLEAGDQVAARTSRTLSVEVPTEEHPIVVSFGHPFTVQPPPPAPSLLHGVIEPLSAPVRDLFRWITANKPESNPTPAIVIARGTGHPPLVVPVLKSPRFVAAGTRRLPLGWAGGKPPFSAQLRRPDGQVAAGQGDLHDTRLLLPPIPLSPGTWTLDVSDAAGHVATGQIDVVDIGAVPTLHDDSLAALPTAAARTVSAAWLAGQGGGRWAYEAAIQSASAGEQFEPARALTEELLRGRLPDR